MPNKPLQDMAYEIYQSMKRTWPDLTWQECADAGKAVSTHEMTVPQMAAAVRAELKRRRGSA